MRETKPTFKIFDAVTLAAERTSEPIDCTDAESLSIAYNFTRVAATGVYFEIDWYPTKYDADEETAAVKFIQQGASGALDGTNFVDALEPYQAKRTVSASELGVFNTTGCLMSYCRIRLNDVASAGATDIVTAYCTLIKS